MSVPAYLLVPDGRRIPGLGRAGRARPRPGQVPGVRPRARGRPGQRLRRRAGPAGPRGAGPRPALLRGAGRLEPARPLRLRHQSGPPGHGRMESADPEPLGPGPGSRRARGAPAGRSGPASAWPASPTGGRSRCSWPHSTNGCRPPWSAATSRRGARPTRSRGTCAAPRCCSACSARWSTPTWARWSPPAPCWSSPGRDDLLFPVAAAEAAVARLRPVYDRLGAGDRLAHDIFDGEHQWHGARAYPFLDRWLGPTPPRARRARPTGSERSSARRVGVEEDGGVRRALEDRRRTRRGSPAPPARPGPAPPCGPRGRRPGPEPARSRAGMVTVIGQRRARRRRWRSGPR